LSGEVGELYIDNYKKVLRTGEVWHHEYECSSIDEMRIFTQSVYALKNNSGLIIVNKIRKTGAMMRVPVNETKFNNMDYTHSNGFIQQCINCRCVQLVNKEEKWEWVEKWVANSPVNVGHSICPVCRDYYWKYSDKNLPLT